MAVSEKDIKILWGRAAGHCSHPECPEELTHLVAGGTYSTGEMAHIIDKKKGGTRSGDGPGPDTYDNLILLCPNHHSQIDKAPEGTFPEPMLHDWKQRHEQRIAKIGKEVKLETINVLKKEVCQLLAENHHLFKELGPKSKIAQEDPQSNAHAVWELYKVGTMVPNNSKIVNMIDSNRSLLSKEQFEESLKFKSHAVAWERHQYEPLDAYPQFPESFRKAFCNE